jgi:HlyD family secretion protein
MTKRVNWMIVGLVGAAVVILAGAGGWWFVHRTPAAQYVTAPVTRGDVVTTIVASGSVNPVVTVQVGSYVSGPIKALYCDYNTRVRKGQLCAKIDPRSYEIIVAEDQASLETARAQLVKDRAGLVYARLAYDRAALLFRQDSGSRDAADLARNAYDQALALVGLDQAQVAQKAASLKAAQINLDYTNIVSPVDGTVVSRNVNVGQTVAASFQTPTLFLIATDLTRMQVDTNVSESDIGGAVEGRDASFTVDAFPDQTFRGRVTQVRQAPISVQNVITYDVVVTVDNPELKLKPGMTATARIVRAEAQNVLRVPSQALRFTPAGAAKPAGGRSANASGGGGRGAHRAVWVQRDGKLVRARVTVGLDDDSFAEIKAGELKLGDQVVVSEAAPAKAGRSGRAGGAATPSLRL